MESPLPQIPRAWPSVGMTVHMNVCVCVCRGLTFVLSVLNEVGLSLCVMRKMRHRGEQSCHLVPSGRRAEFSGS